MRKNRYRKVIFVIIVDKSGSITWRGSTFNCTDNGDRILLINGREYHRVTGNDENIMGWTINNTQDSRISSSMLKVMMNTF